MLQLVVGNSAAVVWCCAQQDDKVDDSLAKTYGMTQSVWCCTLGEV